MRVRRFTAALAAIGLVGLVGCSSDAGDDAGTPDATIPVETDAEFDAGTTMADLAEAGTITVGTKFDQPGFGLISPQDVPEGFDVEIAKIIAGALGIAADDIEWIESVSANREPFLQNGEVDMVVATYTINDERKQRVAFAGPYYVAGQSILVKKDNTAITGLDSLGGKKVCTVLGSTPLKTLQTRAPTADLGILFDTYSKCVEALKDGRVEAVSTDNVILLGFIKDNPGLFKLVGETFTMEPYGIGVKKEDTAFRTFVNDTLEKSYKDGTWAKIFEKEVGKPTEIATPTPPPVNRY